MRPSVCMGGYRVIETEPLMYGSRGIVTQNSDKIMGRLLSGELERLSELWRWTDINSAGERWKMREEVC